MTISCYLSMNLIEMDKFSFLNKSNSCWPPDTSSKVDIISDFSGKRFLKKFFVPYLYTWAAILQLIRWNTWQHAYMPPSKWHMQILDM
jgi:hypothetical protein